MYVFIIYIYIKVPGCPKTERDSGMLWTAGHLEVVRR